ncbi:MAG: class I SAM-dependent rRNA methyltransferase [Spirochaetes bacterium]|nr:class I SAM-dependent rRNA methyltransferase [Spirochaetota bacterium]
MKGIVLKKDKEQVLHHKHPWIFSGAIKVIDDNIPNGAIAPVMDHNKNILAWGYVNRLSDITVRILCFGEKPFTLDTLKQLIHKAIEKRLHNPLLANTNAYRLIHSEGDEIPGLIVDKYDAHLVFQSLTMGIDMLRNEIVQILADITHPESIFERSDHAGRFAEGIEKRSGQIFGVTPDEIIISENNLKFSVDVKNGQKTGFFLDQRENRKALIPYCAHKRMLNLFSYTGGFTIAAFKGGAYEVVSVDSSRQALDMLKKNLKLNHLNAGSIEVCTDAFEYVKHSTEKFDLLVIDPPAFAKSRKDIPSALRGYCDLHVHAFHLCRPGSLVFTFSCSRFISADDFQKILFISAEKSKRSIFILSKYHQPSDHPVNIFAPETEYLKGFLLYVE